MLSGSPVNSALCVSHAIGIPNRQDMPGHLYFCRVPGFTDAIPDDQESARIELEKFSSVLRIVFQKDDPVHFAEFFNRLLTLAQGVFDPAGFNLSPLNDLPHFRQEVVQIAGATIKARYTGKLIKAVLIGSALVILVGASLQWLSSFATSTSAPLSQASGNDKEMPVTASSAPPRQSIGHYLQWDASFSFLHTSLLLAASFFGLLFASITRNIEPTFETLLTPNADLIQPWVRLVFYGIAVFTLALLFETRWLTITFGDRFSTGRIGEDVITAVLVGLFLGVAERALPKELENWSKKILPSSRESV